MGLKLIHVHNELISTLLITLPADALAVASHQQAQWSLMMTSSNRNILHVICPLCWEFTSEFPSQRPVMRSFDVCFDLRLNKRLSKQLKRWWFETASHSLWCHFNVSKVCRSKNQNSIQHYLFLYVKALLKGLRYINTLSSPLTIIYCRTWIFPSIHEIYSYWAQQLILCYCACVIFWNEKCFLYVDFSCLWFYDTGIILC